jgi:4,5-DOPA dioxygenase extradiol
VKWRGALHRRGKPDALVFPLTTQGTQCRSTLTMKTPVIFVSHGAPTLPLEPGATGSAWRALGASLAKPRAILLVSAHWETPAPIVSGAKNPSTIHDFSGFPAALYQLRYAAQGAPDLADEVVSLLTQAGIAVSVDATRGLDHGAWVPLSFLFPDAEIPVAQLSIQPAQNAAWHFNLGVALQALRDKDVLIIGSGSITHNLRAVFSHPADTAAPVWVTEFCDWIDAKIQARDFSALCQYRSLAPHALQNHPTDEHLLPLFVTLGAAGHYAHVERLNQVMTYRLLAMDAWLLTE